MLCHVYTRSMLFRVAIMGANKKYDSSLFVDSGWEEGGRSELRRAAMGGMGCGGGRWEV